ncbi:MAG: NtaA/DmoA family FMN-dependent monooxygenase [Janthinobacterium lividum]
MADPFHLAWFLQGSSIQAWGEPWTGNISQEWMSADMFLDLARSIERACFDYLLIEDSIYIGQNWQNSRDIFLKNGMSVPRQEPTVVASLMMAATSRLGIVPTLSTFAYHPYLTARIVGTLDQVSGGRAGWNMVTGSSDFSGQNFGLDRLPEHDTRYDMAAEYIDVVTKLWDSWEPGAIRADHASGVLIDPTKVHTIDHKGEYYASRGPLNSGPCPQGRPVIAQAGGSAKGRAIAAQYADTVVAHPKGVEAMRDYRRDVRSRMAEAGRNPDHCKVLFMATPVLANTDEEAQARAALRSVATDDGVRRRLAQMGWTTNLDFSGYDLDAPVGELTTNGHQSSLANFLKKAGGRTLREAIIAYTSHGGSVDLVGTPETVAAQMAEAMQEVGGDGFLLVLPDVSRKTVAEVTDGLVPALQRRGLVRRNYSHAHFRDNLLEF